MESIDKQILKSIKKCGRGLVLFADRFSHFGTPALVQKAIFMFYIFMYTEMGIANNNCFCNCKKE